MKKYLPIVDLPNRSDGAAGVTSCVVGVEVVDGSINASLKNDKSISSGSIK